MIRPGRGNGTVPRALLGGRDDLGEPGVERPSLARRLASGDRGAEERVREPHSISVQLEDATSKGAGKPRLET